MFGIWWCPHKLRAVIFISFKRLSKEACAQRLTMLTANDGHVLRRAIDLTCWVYYQI